jgi:hypothetical protein
VDGTWNRVGCWLDVAVVLKPVSSSSDVHLSFAVVLMVEKVLLGVLPLQLIHHHILASLKRTDDGGDVDGWRRRRRVQ